MTESVLLALALMIVAAVSGGLGALRSASRIWLRHYVDLGVRGGAVAEQYLERPQRLVVATGTTVAAAAFTTAALVADSGDVGWALIGRVALWAATFLALGQLVPRAIGRRWPMVFVPALAPVLAALLDLTSPIGAVVEFLVAPIRRRVRRTATVQRDDLADVLREGELEGVGRQGDRALIAGVVRFVDKRIGDVMTPREDVFAVDVTLPPHEIAARIAAAAYSRVPLYDGTLDKIAGMVHAFDVLKYGADALPPLRPLAEAPATMRCRELLYHMLRDRLHFAVVRGADGRVAGVVTLEDMIEELVGDISDEHDEHDEPGPPSAPRVTGGA